MTPQPSPAHKLCLSCKDWHLRKLFRANTGDGVMVYDTVCRECRKKINKTARMKRVVERMEAGLLSPEDKERIRLKRIKARGEKTSRGLKRWRESLCIPTWESVIASASKASVRVRKYPYATAEEKAWGVEASAFLAAAQKEFALRRKKEKLSPDVQFWYQALHGGVRKVQELLNKYPTGANNAPITYF